MFDEHNFSKSRPQPWHPALGEGSAAINNARFLDALSGKRTPPIKAEQQQSSATTDMASYMRMKRATDPKYQKRRKCANHYRPKAPCANATADNRPKRSHHKPTPPISPIEKICIMCGKPFTICGSIGRKAKVCSPECKRARKVQRKAAWDAKQAKS
jgi:hypothetical protein